MATLNQTDTSFGSPDANAYSTLNSQLSEHKNDFENT